MKKLVLILSVVATAAILTSCGGGMGGSNFFVKYTDKDGKSVNMSSSAVTYTYTGGVYLNSFGGTPNMVAQFMLEDETDFTPEGMEGKTMKVMIFESDKTIIWSSEDWDDAKTFTCNIESFTFVKDGMMDDKTYKVTAKFSNNNFKDGELALQVNI